MKILKIENGVGYIVFNLKNTSEYKKIEETTKEDILAILDFAIENELEFDEITIENDLLNPVQKTIYSNLYEQFNAFNQEKDNLIKEVDNQFKDAENKYLHKQ